MFWRWSPQEAFGIAPMVNKFADNRTDVVRVTRDITQGHRLTEDDIAVITVGSYNLPAGVITDKTAVVGLYAACDMKKDDWFLPSKLNDTADSASDVFKSLDGKQVAISVTIPSFAGGLSAKLKNGDVVSLIVYQNEDGEEAAFVPEELKYVRVITSTTADGVDKDELVQNDDGTYELPTTLTLLADPVQADLLAKYEHSAKLHAALVCRDNEKLAKQYLEEQAQILDDLSENESEEDEEDVNG